MHEDSHLPGRNPLLPRASGEAAGRCPACGGKFEVGFFYVSGGALLLDEGRLNSIQTRLLEGFLSFGYHGRDPEMEDSDDYLVVDDVAGGQFELQWCSSACFRKWINGVVDEIEKRCGFRPSP
jgi:hypothetical protein